MRDGATGWDSRSASDGGDSIREGVSTKQARLYRLLEWCDRDRSEDRGVINKGNQTTSQIRTVRSNRRNNIGDNKSETQKSSKRDERKEDRGFVYSTHVKMFGSVEYDGCKWKISCEPHVAIKLKGLFPRIAKGEFGTHTLLATEKNSRDLEWFLARYPMKLNGCADILYERSREQDRRCILTEEILSGKYEIPTFKMVLPPRSYQAKTALLAHHVGGLLCADELGLGKTVTALTVLSNSKTLPALVVCPTHLPNQWERETNRFLPELKTHVCKTGKICKLDNPDVIIINYHKLYKWADVLAPYVNTIIFDECQDLRRNESDKYRAALHISSNCSYRLGCSATPIYNYGGEFFNIMDCLAPGVLGSRAEFMREWCTGYSYNEDKARIRNPKAFGTFLRESGHMVLHTKKEVGRELPDLNIIYQDVDSDISKLKKIKSAATELATFIVSQNKVSGFEMMRASQEFSNTLRQATGIAKAHFVASFVDMLMNQDEPIVLFGWHRECYAMWKERFSSYYPAWFTGSESPAKKQKEIDRFINGETKLLIMSLRSGSGVDGLQNVCSRVVIGELDWSPGALSQCIGRIHRDGQKEPVFVYYLISNEGADPIMADVLGLKKSQLEGVLHPEGELIKKSQVDPNHIKKLAEDFLKRG